MLGFLVVAAQVTPSPMPKLLQGILLPEANSRRLRAAIEEIETLNVAYISCRARLLHDFR